MSEKNGQPFNAVARFSIAGLNDFTRDYTPSFELIASRSLGPRAQFYLVPTVSIHNRPLAPQILPQPCSLTTAAGFSPTSNIKPCSDTFALGVGLAVDIRPTVALLFEVNPTLAGGTELGIHRPPYGFAIQKKIYRHAFTFGVTTGPGTTIAQRIGTRAAPLGDPRGDLPSRLSIGFNLSRQLR
jgi:hypothetical protein